ncbi:MAG TPA: hypothetical protein VLT33_25915 [Labilithrix sp.]|nr:hypothetical protein [Labilithrix sp.]
MRALPSLALALALTTLVGAARADSHEEAERVFREARASYDAHDYATACPRFAESQRLEPAAGTLLNLADCYEHMGLLASALTTYKEAVVAAASRKRRDWEQFALTRIELLRPAVPVLTIKVSGAARVEGLVITRDGTPVASSDLGLDLMLDPGPHEIVARAPGREPWSTKIVAQRGRSYVVEVPATGTKQTAPPPPARAEPRPASEPPGSWQRPAGYAATGVGGALVVFGAVAGGVALSAGKDARSRCPSYPTACTAEGTAANERAFGWATASTATFIAGGILAAAGVVLLLTAPRATSAQIAVSPAGALQVRGAF